MSIDGQVPYCLRLPKVLGLNYPCPDAFEARCGETDHFLSQFLKKENWAEAAWERLSAEFTRMNRQIIIKILPEQFGCDPAWCEQQIQLSASRNHLNTTVVDELEGIEEVRLLAVEASKDNTLAERLTKGQLE